MKKYLFGLVSVILVSVLVTFAIPLSAAEDWYSQAKDGDLLYTPNFNGDDYFKPATTQGTMNYVVDPADPGKVTLTSGPKGLNFWGSEISTLPLDENTAYTIFFTATREGKDSCLGVFVDNLYGIYGYSYNQRFLESSKTLTNHNTMKYADLGIAAEGDNFAATGSSVQRYAIEVNGQLSTLKMYVKNTADEWVLVDETAEGEILTFATYNLGIFFYVYNEADTITVSDISIYKGMTISGEKLEEITTPEATTTPKAPETTPAATTPAATTAANTTATPGGAATTKAPDATTTAGAKDDKKSGCGSALAGSAVMLAGFAAAAVCFKKKK